MAVTQRLVTKGAMKVAMTIAWVPPEMELGDLI
jgi:hypothetical protein